MPTKTVSGATQSLSHSTVK